MNYVQMINGNDGPLATGLSLDGNDDNKELLSREALIAWLSSLFTSKDDFEAKLAAVVENITVNLNANSREAQSNAQLNAAALAGEIRIKLDFCNDSLIQTFIFYF